MIVRLLIAACCFLPLQASEAHPDPAVIVEDTVTALRSADLQRWLETLPPTQREELRRLWDGLRQTPLKPARIGSTNMLLTMLTAPRAADNLMTLIEPQLAALEGAEVALLLDHWQRWLSGFRDRLPASMTRDNLDVILSLMPELREWSRSVALDDPERMRQALGLATDWLREQEIRSVDQVFALDLEALAERASGALGVIKEIATLYGIDLDAFLDSVAVRSQGSDDVRTLSVDFEVLGQQRSIERRVERVGDGWMPLIEDADLVALEEDATTPEQTVKLP